MRLVMDLMRVSLSYMDLCLITMNYMITIMFYSLKGCQGGKVRILHKKINWIKLMSDGIMIKADWIIGLISL